MPGFEDRLRRTLASIEAGNPRLAAELKGLRSKRRPAAPDLTVESVSPPLGGNGHAGFSAELALETIVLRTGRPVLMVLHDEAKLDFHDAESEVWRDRLLRARELLGRAVRAVGRIEVEHHAFSWLGTGWLVAPGVVVTNRHVATEFAVRQDASFVFRQGFGGQMAARIDFLEEYQNDASREFSVTRVLHIEDDPGPDLALLEVEQRAGDALASPIALAATDATPHREVAVIGYPARDSRIPDQGLMLQIFGDVFDKKRLAPGEVVAVDGGVVNHNCSTVGGNSGSVVLDLDSGAAVGLHFSGRFLEANYAVPATTVRDILRRRGLEAKA